MSKLIVVKFTEHCPLKGFNIYKPGDVAGFSVEDAETLLNGTKIEQNGRSIKVGPWAKKVSETSTEKVTAQRNKELEAERLEKAKADAEAAQAKLAEASGETKTETKADSKTDSKASGSDDKSDDKSSKK